MTNTNTPQSEAVTHDGARPAAVSQMEPAAPSLRRRPPDDELIGFIASEYGVSFGTACDWILETAERMKVSA